MLLGASRPALSGSAASACAGSDKQLGEMIMHKEAGHQIESAVEARAGFLDRPVLLILCVSTIVAAFAMGVALIGMKSFGAF